jgi:diguanylate cyclase (GGDEF)-like protein
MRDAKSVLMAFFYSYRDIVSSGSLERKLTAIAEALVDAGLFRRAAVQLYTSRYGEKLFGFAGVTPAEAEWLRTHDILEEEEYRRVQQHGLQLEEVYFVPHDRLRLVLPNVDDLLLSDSSRAPSAWQEGHWHPDDMLYMPLIGSDGVPLGNITADDPFDDRVPDMEMAALLCPFVAMAAAVVEQELNRRRDFMTQCFNGQFFRDEVERRMQFPGRDVGLVFVDMNGLKAVNDRLGHAAGDRAIRETAAALTAVAQQLASSFIRDPVVCRLYGDEFAVLFQPLPSIAPTAVAEAFLSRWPERVPPAAVGVAVRRPDDDGQSLVRRAEAEMYRAKQRMQGPNDTRNLWDIWGSA